MDDRAVRHRQGRRGARQHQPGLSRPRARVRRQAVRHAHGRERGVLQDLDLPADARVHPARLPGPGARRLPRRAVVGGPAGRGCRRRRRGPRRADGRDRLGAVGRVPRRAPRRVQADRPGHGRRRRPGRGAAHAAPGGQRQGALLPLLRHGHGQPGVHLPRRGDGHPGADLRPGRDPGGGVPGGLHQPLRRPHDVHRRARAAGRRPLRPVDAAHGDHGRLALPGGGHEEGHRPDEHGRGRHQLRHDRDLAGLHLHAHRGRTAPPHRDGRPRHVAPCRAARRASCAPAATR